MMKKGTKILNLKLILSFVILTTTIFNCTPESTYRDGLREVNFKATATRTLITENETVVFKDSSASVDTRLWTFEGGNITSSDLQEVSVIYDTPGLYGTKLEVTYTDNTTEDNVFNIQVFPRVVAAFTASSTTALFGSEITFTNASENLESEFQEARLKDGYMWTFEGGTPATSTEVNPVVTYNTPGVYSVKLVAHREAPNNDGVLIKENHIIVLASIPLVPNFTEDLTTVEETETVTFTDATTGNADGWSWTFEGGTPATSTAQNPTVTYNTAGTYDVTLVATRSVDGENQTLTKTDHITVTAATGPYCNTAANWVGCGNNDGEEASLTDWEILGDNGDDISSSFSVSTTRAASGAASLKHVYSNPAGTSAFADNLLKYNGKLLQVTSTTDYKLSMELFADIISSGDIRFVGEISFEKVGGGSFKQFFNTDGNVWTTISTVKSLAPGDYFVQIKIWNPPFNPNLQYDLYIDDIVVIEN